MRKPDLTSELPAARLGNALTFGLGLVVAGVASVFGQQNRIDVIAPYAPELAAYGPYEVGVRTLQFTDRNRVDVLKTKPGGPTVHQDRRLTLEVWYPATLPAGQKAEGEYRVVAREPGLIVTLRGRAVRDAAMAGVGEGFPLVILSHGFPGNRFLLSHAGENLASKGYVAVSIDHPESTYEDHQAFSSSLYNRSLDQMAVLGEISRLAAAGSGNFLSGRVDASRTALVGYSMGAVGVVNAIGGGFSQAAETYPGGPPNRLLADRGAANPDYRRSLDPRIKAAVAIAPWGMQVGLWDAAGLAGIRIPVLFVAGSVDETSGYEAGVKAIFRGAVHADRYLLTFLQGGHNVAAPIPAPAETYAFSEKLQMHPFQHYADPVWDSVRSNNILDHFLTAFLDVHLRGQQEKLAYLTLAPSGAEARGESAWKGFRPKTAAGLKFERLPAAP